MIRSEYTANLALQHNTNTAWQTPSRCVRERKTTLFARLLSLFTS